MKGLYAGVPVIIGRNGVERIVELQLTDEERKAFNNSVNMVREVVAAMDALP